ncbi:MAG: transposase, partial [Bacteroidetes bacterium]|nr:transposase [Bacteroidota bacterium]
ESHNKFMVELKWCRNFVYQTAYHLVWCPKHRKQVLIGAKDRLLEKTIEKRRHSKRRELFV